MALNRPVELHPKQFDPSRRFSKEQPGFSPWLFQHQDLIRAMENAEPVSQETLVNAINRIHFTEGSVLVHVRHPKYEESIFFQAHPDPCTGRELTCHWSDKNPLDLNLLGYQLLHLIIEDGKSIILVPGKLQSINQGFFSVQLPEISYSMGQRRARRFVCKEVVAELSQSGFHAIGELLDFSPVGLRMRVRPERPSSFHWFNTDELVSVQLRHDKQVFFSGACECIREQHNFRVMEIVLAPRDEGINRFKKKPIRNPRVQLLPSPSITFDHPLLRKRFQLEVCDMSTSGFSVYEEADEGVLMPGIIIPGLEINFGCDLTMKCTAQVIYRLKAKEEGIRCGLAILDMDINTHSRLTHILTKALNSHAYICNAVDMDALWEFLFDTGFIYPMKYRLIQSQKESFKETYRKLYQEKPEITRHFTYQKNGRIHGHISMVRAYDRTWMIHHFAAKASGSKRTGFMVLKQIMHCLNDMCRLPSAKMDYVMCYFRPENKFPNHIFGGFAKSLKNVRACSVDLFTYLPYTSLSLGTDLPEGWSLRESSTKELWELELFYIHYSGGLLLKALGLDQRDSRDESLEEVYGRLGFLRKWKAYSLTYRGELNAVLIVNQSDPGINLSELLNAIKILVTNPEGLPWNVLSTAVAQLTAGYDMQKVPILFYPFDYVQAKELPYEKQYKLWILNVRYGQEYLEYMQRRFKISY